MKKIDVHAHTGKWLFEVGYGDETAAKLAKRWDIEKAIFSSAYTLMTNDVDKGNGDTYDFVLQNDFAYMYVVMTPHDVKGSIRSLSHYAGKRKVAGVKLHPEQFKEPLTSPRHMEILKAVSDSGLPVLTHTTHASWLQTPQLVGEAAKRFPDIRFVMAHFGCAMWRECIQVMKECPNTYVDVVTSWLQYPMLERGVAEAGGDRLLFGTDMTLLDPGPIVGSIESAELTDRQKEDIFYNNALKVFRFDD